MLRMKQSTVGPDGRFVDADEPVPSAWITQSPMWVRGVLNEAIYDDGEESSQPALPPPVPVIVPSPATSGMPVPEGVLHATRPREPGAVLDASATLNQKRSVEG